MDPERLDKVSRQHVWVGFEDQHAFLGLTNYDQGELGQVISLELPEVGDEVERGGPLRNSNPLQRSLN